ncbi:recombinase family protein [Pseudonocardia sp. WMMC193]|uniref:recombinase family protein n=1 Tax=Pseudonocardia sp. WMMC193 TaxID=2911965 RepID=UPI001F1E000C|nr:recombinase family protein [Pseudonocardia sp. WMMC193]MCF7548524.1 recombinase family protein [Pseudonocardia sp. WMMC193]
MDHKGGLYLRISQDRVGAGLGVERQEQDGRQLAERLGIPIVDVYVDNDTSAYSGKTRPEYERLIADIESGYVTAVLAWHADRLHRSPVELERYIAVCEQHDVPTHTVRAGVLDLSTAAGRMTARITGAVARHESEQKGERVARQKQQAQAAGKWLGGRRPFGFQADGVTPHPEEAAAIVDATRRALAGETMRSIFTEWNSLGRTTTTGRPWTGSQLRQMLLRPRNAGLVGNLERIVGEAEWAPLVDREAWEALRALLTDSARVTHSGNTSRKLIGSFLYRCDCGEVVMSGGQRSDGGGRYACRTMHMRRAAAPIDDLVLRVVAAKLDAEGIELMPASVDLAPLQQRRDTLRVRSEEIAAMFADPSSGMTGDQFRTANARVQHDLREAEAALGRASSGSALAGIADVPKPGEAFLRAGIDRQRLVIDTLLTVVIRRVASGRRADGSYFDPESVEFRWR